MYIQIGTFLEETNGDVQKTIEKIKESNYKSLRLEELLSEFGTLMLDELNEKLEKENNISRPTSFTLLKDGKNTGINFCGIPGGHEFNSFVLAILGLAGIGKKLEGEQLTKVQGISKQLNIETYISLSCTKCPEVIQALNLIAMNNENITASLVDGGVYPDEVKEKNIQGVPVVYINGEKASVGEKTIEELINIVTSA